MVSAAFFAVGVAAFDGEHAAPIGTADRARGDGSVSPLDGRVVVAGRAVVARVRERRDADIGKRGAFGRTWRNGGYDRSSFQADSARQVEQGGNDLRTGCDAIAAPVVRAGIV